MAIQSGYGFTNKTASTKTLPLVKLGEDTNYALLEDEAGMTYLSNLTSPLDQAEKVSIKAQSLSKVTTGNVSNYPNPVGNAGGIQFSIKDELLYRAVDGSSATENTPNWVDIPVVVTLTVKHGKHAAITDSVVQEAVSRAVSSLFTDGGESRIPALQRLATKPVED